MTRGLLYPGCGLSDGYGPSAVILGISFGVQQASRRAASECLYIYVNPALLYIQPLFNPNPSRHKPQHHAYDKVGEKAYRRAQSLASCTVSVCSGGDNQNWSMI